MFAHDLLPVQLLFAEVQIVKNDWQPGVPHKFANSVIREAFDKVTAELHHASPRHLHWSHSRANDNAED